MKKKMKKKMMAALLIGVLTMTALAGCGSKETESKSNENADATVDVEDTSTEYEIPDYSEVLYTGKTSSGVDISYCKAYYFSELDYPGKATADDYADKTTFVNIQNLSPDLLAGLDFENGVDFTTQEFTTGDVEQFIQNLEDYQDFFKKCEKKHKKELSGELKASEATWVSLRTTDNDVISIAYNDDGTAYAIHSTFPNADAITGFAAPDNLDWSMDIDFNSKTLTLYLTNGCKFGEDLWAALPEEYRSETTDIEIGNHDLFIRIDGSELYKEEGAIEKTQYIINLLKEAVPDGDFNRVYISFVADYERSTDSVDYLYNFSTYTTWDDPSDVDVLTAAFYPIEREMLYGYNL